MATYADPIAPVVARGEAESEAVANWAPGSTHLNFSGTNANYSIGDSVWVSHDSGYTNLQYRGLVTSRDGNNGIYVSIESSTQCTSGIGRCWKASALCQFAFAQNKPTVRIDFGNRIRKSQGGTPYVTATASTSQVIPLTFINVSVAEFLSFTSFAVTTLSNGLYEFTLSWFDFTVNLVRTAKVILFSPTLVPNSPQMNMVSFSIECLIVTENIYE